MKEKKNYLYVDTKERTLRLHSLVELIFKVVNVPIKRMKIEYV